MIDEIDRTAHYLLKYIACEVLCGMRDGKTLAEIDDHLSFRLRKKDRVALFEYMAEQFPPECYGEEGDAIVAHLRALKRRKRSPQPTPIARNGHSAPTDRGTTLIPPTKVACAQCGAETDYYLDVPEDAVCCSQCCCLFAGRCDDCEGECRGMAWPEGYPPSLH